MIELPIDARYSVFAGIGAAASAIFLKLLDRSFQLRDRKVDEGVAARRELLDERIELRDRLEQSEAALVAWREKYFALLEQDTLLKARAAELEQRLKRQHPGG